MKHHLPTEEQLIKAQQENVWDFGNAVLYNLCKDNFLHKEDKHILSKVLFIGRIYAAAVERRKIYLADINDNFYTERIAPAFRKSDLDDKLFDLKSVTTNKPENIELVLQTHYYLIEILKEITALGKRSFSSKYLHFHLPNLFYIYDSRAFAVLRQFKYEVPKDLEHLLKRDNIDIEYAKFYCDCFSLKGQIKEHFGIELTPRQLDNLLIEIANNQNVEKKKLHGEL